MRKNICWHRKDIARDYRESSLVTLTLCGDLKISSLFFFIEIRARRERRKIYRKREKEEGREKKERKSRFDVPRFFLARFIFHATLRPGVCSNTVTQKNSGAKRPPEYEKLNGFVSSNVYFVFLCPVRSDTFQEATVANVVCMSGKS